MQQQWPCHLSSQAARARGRPSAMQAGSHQLHAASPRPACMRQATMSSAATAASSTSSQQQQQHQLLVPSSSNGIKLAMDQQRCHVMGGASLLLLLPPLARAGVLLAWQDGLARRQAFVWHVVCRFALLGVQRSGATPAQGWTLLESGSLAELARPRRRYSPVTAQTLCIPNLTPTHFHVELRGGSERRPPLWFNSREPFKP